MSAALRCCAVRAAPSLRHPLARSRRAAPRAASMRRPHGAGDGGSADAERGEPDDEAEHGHRQVGEQAPLRHRTPSPTLADGAYSRRVAHSPAEADAPRPASSSLEVQRELARRTHPHPRWPAVAENDNIDAVVVGGDFWVEARTRGQWLMGLLVLQSLSSFVLEANEGLIREHLVITLFLTMLVGAGGNSGAQSAVFVIRGLATGQIAGTTESFKRVLSQQLRVGLLLGTGLALGGYARVYLSEGVPLDAAAIAVALFLIVNASVVAGASLPFLLAWRGVDPAHAGTTVQVLMDVAGVGITCAVCRMLLAGAGGAGVAVEHAAVAAAELAAAAGGA